MTGAEFLERLYLLGVALYVVLIVAALIGKSIMHDTWHMRLGRVLATAVVWPLVCVKAVLWDWWHS